MEYEKEVAIIDGERQYFRPSIYNMEKEVNYEVVDYKGGLIKDSLEDLTIINQSYSKICFIRKRMMELKCEKSENSIDIMVLLGVEYKLNEQMEDVEGFIKHYKNSINLLGKKLSSFKHKIFRLFLCSKANVGELPQMQNLVNQNKKLELFINEKSELESLHQFIRGKLLYLSDNNIAKLGIIKD